MPQFSVYKRSLVLVAWLKAMSGEIGLAKSWQSHTNSLPYPILVHAHTDERTRDEPAWCPWEDFFRLPVNRALDFLSAHQIEVFDILSPQFDGKAFEPDDFHECLTFPLPFDRDVATVRRPL